MRAALPLDAYVRTARSDKGGRWLARVRLPPLLCLKRPTGREAAS